MAPLILPLVASLAPALARLVTGSDQAAPAARAVVRAVERVAGVSPETEAGAREARRLIEADPAMAARLGAELAEIEARELDALLSDRQDARARDVSIRRLGEGNLRANLMLALAFLSIVAIAASLLLLNRFGAPGEFTGAIFGFLTGVGGMFARNIGSAFDFEFGSSRGSKNKDAQIEQISAQMRALAQASEIGRDAALDAVRARLRP